MGKSLFFIILFALMLNAPVFAQQVTPQPVIPGQWIKSWLICGPIPLQFWDDPVKLYDHLQGFTADYLQKQGGETNLKLKEGDLVRLKKGTIRWKHFLSSDSIINLLMDITREAPVTAYAYTEVSADKDEVWTFALGSNDGCLLWINDKLVWDFKNKRGIKPDEDIIPVVLKKGINKILLKVEQHGGNWGFCARFLPFLDTQLSTKGDLFSVSSIKKHDARITALFSEDVLCFNAKQLQISVFDDNNKLVYSDTREHSFFNPFELAGEGYRNYTVNLNLTLNDGKVLSQISNFSMGKWKEYSLFDKGVSNYKIRCSNNASESEIWSARELQHWIREISGVELPICDPKEQQSGPQIMVGYQDSISKKFGPKPPAGDDSYRYFNDGADIVIYGGSVRGTMYGVFSFLENELGCRWYTSTATVIPTREKFGFSRISHAESPGINIRNVYYKDAFNPEWAARNKVNGALQVRNQPGGVESHWSDHSFYSLLPASEFAEKHPEYFSLINGKRLFENAQLCLSNPEVLRIVTERIEERMRQKPGFLIYDVTQNDAGNPCQCERCQQIVKEYGSESGIMVWFVNQVAAHTAKEFPDKYVATFAYLYTRKAPVNIRPRENVIIRFCSIECCFAHDFTSACPENVAYMKDLKAWSKLTSRLSIWDYGINFMNYLLPYPNFAVIQPNIRTFKKYNAFSVMEQANSQSNGGEFAELRAYLFAKLLWNPDLDLSGTINDFMAGYYGRSGKYVRSYFDLLQGLVDYKTHLYCVINELNIYSEAFIGKSLSIFEEAEKVADSPEILRRVQRTALSVLYLKCRNYPELALRDGSYQRCKDILEREEVTHFDENLRMTKKIFDKKMESFQLE